MSGTRPVPYMPEQLGRVIQAGLSGAGEPEKALRELIDLAEWALRSADKPNVGTGGTLDDRRDLEPQRPNETELDNDIRRALQEADQGERNCRVDLATGLNTKTLPAILAEGRERAAWMRRLAIAALRGVCVTPVAAPAVSRGPAPEPSEAAIMAADAAFTEHMINAPEIAPGDAMRIALRAAYAVDGVRAIDGRRAVEQAPEPSEAAIDAADEALDVGIFPRAVVQADGMRHERTEQGGEEKPEK